MRPLLVTRAAEDAAPLAERLGPHAIVAPCLAYEPAGGDPPALTDADLLVTSPRAVPALARAPGGWRVLALVPTTAAAVRAAGYRVDVEVSGGAADLARAGRPGPLVCATSDLGGDEVRRVRPDAVLWVVYRTVCPDALPPAAVAALAGEFDVLFTSPSAVRNFERLAPGALARATRVLCHGRTTLAAVPRDAELVTLPS
ncbi:MAG: uroporphyrinogen-III synthase [Myxococcota bacterium]